MAISPICTVNASQTLDGVNVTGGGNVTIQLADLSGVKQWSIQCINTDDVNTPSGINASLIPNINYITKTATFTAPSVPNGSAMIFQSQVNNGQDSNGRIDSSLTTRFGIFVLTGGGNRIFAFDERLESNHTYGWLKKINDLIRAVIINPIGQAGIGLYYSGGAFNIGADNDSITLSADGIKLKQIYKTLLDQATPDATPETLALRDEFGDIAFHDANFNQVNTATVVATGQITTSNAAPNGISAPNGDITAFRFAVTDLGSNKLIIRKSTAQANTADINAISGWALKIYTENTSGSSQPVTVVSGDVGTGAFVSGARIDKSGNAVGTAATGTYASGSGTSVNGATGAVTSKSGSSSGSGNPGAYSAGSGDAASGTPGDASFAGGNSSTGTGGKGILKGGNGGLGAGAYVRSGNSTNALTKGAPVFIVPGTGTTAGGGVSGICLGDELSGADLSNMTKCLHIFETTIEPAAAPSVGAYFWIYRNPVTMQRSLRIRFANSPASLTVNAI